MALLLLALLCRACGASSHLEEIDRLGKKLHDHVQFIVNSKIHAEELQAGHKDELTELLELLMELNQCLLKSEAFWEMQGRGRTIGGAAACVELKRIMKFAKFLEIADYAFGLPKYFNKDQVDVPDSLQREVAECIYWLKMDKRPGKWDRRVDVQAMAHKALAHYADTAEFAYWGLVLSTHAQKLTSLADKKERSRLYASAVELAEISKTFRSDYSNFRSYLESSIYGEQAAQGSDILQVQFKRIDALIAVCEATKAELEALLNGEHPLRDTKRDCKRVAQDLFDKLYGAWEDAHDEMEGKVGHFKSKNEIYVLLLSAEFCEHAIRLAELQHAFEPLRTALLR